MIGTTLSHFKITAKLGEGGMGEVYRADDTKLGREVAIKVLPATFTENPERLARFEREAKVLASLNHQNIAGIYEVGENETEPPVHFLAMELVEGPTLAELLAQGPMSLEGTLPVALQIAAALEDAHEKGVIHRDLKPQNIKLTPEGKVKVLDFGLAKAMDPEQTAAASSPDLTHSPTMTLGATMEGVVLGTAAYMSPEQAKGQVVDKRADIWAFGVVLWEMLTGERLFSADTAPETLARVLTDDPDLGALPESVPSALSRLVRRTLRRSPSDRLRDIGDARLVLEDIQHGRFEEDAPTAVPVEAPRARARKVITSAVVVLAIAAAAMYLARPTEQTRPPRVVRATLPLPEGVWIELDGTRAGIPAISPDGTRIAFGGRRGAEPLRIWVLDIATGEARPLAGTDYGYRPFWSPDGGRIAFFTWSNLSVISSDGGPVTHLTRARNSRGGTWSPSGRLVFAPYSYGPLRSISEAGGDVDEITLVEEGSLSTHRFPWFLPDSRHYLYLRRTGLIVAPWASSGEQGGVFVGRLDSVEPVTRALELETRAVHSLGYLLYAQGSSLVAQPFDADTHRLSGEPRSLVDNLLVNRRFAYGVFSASDNGVLAFLTGEQRDLSRIVWRDRAGTELGQLGDPVNNQGGSGFDLSPNGNWAAVAAVDPATTNGDVWLHDLLRGAATRLGGVGTDDLNPVFSRDSRRLFYSSSGDQEQRLVERELSSGEERTVFAHSEAVIDFYPRWETPDGRWLVAERRVVELQTRDIVRVSLDGSNEFEPMLAGPEDEWLSELSPDGRWVAFVSEDAGRYEVYVASYPDLANTTRISRSGGVEPRWGLDGAELFFKQADNWVVAVSIEELSGTLAVGEPLQLFRVAESNGPTYAVGTEERFLTREPVVEQDASSITLLTEWPALLDK